MLRRVSPRRRTRRLGAVALTVGLMALAPAARSIDFDAGALEGAVIWNGTVVSGSGVPYMYVGIPGVNGALVRDDGRYLFAAVPPGPQTVEVYANNCGPYPPNKLGSAAATVVAGTATTADVDITATTGRLIGTITVNNTPLPWGQLTVVDSCGGWYTDGTGAFSNYLQPGTHSVIVRGPSGILGTFTFTIVAGQTTDLGTLSFDSGALEGAVIWNGTVVSGSGVPYMYVGIPGVNGALVRDDGRYLFAAVPPGPQTVEVYANNCGPYPPNKLGSAAATVVAGTATTADVDITATTGRLIGTITVNNTPLPWGQLTVVDSCGGWYTDGTGAFSNYLQPGTHSVIVRGPSGILGTFTFTIVAGQTTDLGTLSFDSGALEGAVIWNGTVVSGSGVPYMYVGIPGVNGALVRDDGRYLFAAVPPGPQTVEVYANNCGPYPPNKLGSAAATVVAGTATMADVDITATTGRLIGTITVNNTPLPWGQLTVVDSCGGWYTDGTGAFSNYLQPGTHSVIVRGPSGILGTFTFTIVAGQTTDVDFGSTPIGTNVSVELSGGLDSPGGIGLTFSTINAGGSTVVVESGAGPPPPTGYRIVGLGGQPRYWDIDTTATYSGPITVCIRYDITQVRGPETQLRLVHDAGDGFRDITTSIDTAGDVICGETTSLSPFAVVESLDATPPTLHLPSTVQVEATGAAGAVATYAATATDADPVSPSVTCTPSSGSTFPVGTTTVSCSATDARGNAATATFRVDVVDTTPPVVTVPADLTAAPTSVAGAAVSYSGQRASDLVDGSVPVTCTPASGSTFGFGTARVTCTAVDGMGNVGSSAFSVTVTPFAFTGFLPSVDNVPAVNTVKAGSTVPVKWKLSASGTAITSTEAVSAGWPKQAQVSCSTFTGAEDEVTGTTTGATGLRYDDAGGQFVYNWKTPDAAGTCWRLEVNLVDGTSHVALVKLK